MRQFKPGQLQTGSLYNISSSYALTASYATNAGVSLDTGSLVTTASFNAFTASYGTGSFTGSFTGTLTGTASYADYATSADNAGAIDIYSFSADIDSYVLVSNVISTTGVAVGGDSDLRYNSGTNKLTVGSVSATSLTGSLLGTASFATSASYAPDTTFPYTGSARITGSLIVTGSTTATQIGAGAAPSGSVRLDVRAQGATSSDTALRVRNSGNTYDILAVRGDSSVQIGSDTLSNGKLTIASAATAILNLDTPYSTDTATISVSRRISPTYNTNAFLFTQNDFADGNVQPYKFHFVNPSNYWGYTEPGFSYIFDAGFMWFKDSATAANLQMKLTPDNALQFYTSSRYWSVNGNNPPLQTYVSGGFQIYASGSPSTTGGNTIPYIRTENGTLIWLGSESRLYNVTASIISASAVTASLFGTASWARNAITASYAVYAETASSATNAQDILVYVLNNSGYTIPKGTVVHITASGNSSDIPRIISASYENDANSANTLGIANETITNGNNGFVMTDGVLKGIDTSNFVSGQLIYLGASGSILGYAPQAPLHSVRLGQVVRVQQNNGSIYVRIDNGYELEELHDVRIITASLQYGDLLMRSGSVWTNTKQLSGSYNINGSLTATQITASNLYAGTTYVSGSLTVFGPSTFYGSASFVSVTASNLFVSESFISVNVFEPVERFGGLKVYDSGSSTATASLAWDSLHNHWVYQNAEGSTYSGGMLLSGPRNTGSLGDEPTLTRWFVPRADGGDHLNDTQIFSSASIHQMTGSLTVTGGITGSLSGNASSSTTASYAHTASYLTGYTLRSSNNTVSLNWDTRILSDGTVTAVNWGNRTLSDTFTVQSVDWGNRLLKNNTSTTILDWQNATFTGSVQGTASYALTASYLDNYIPPFPYTGSAEISGSLTITGSLNVSGTAHLNTIRDHYNTTGSNGQLMISDGEFTKWLTLKDSLQLQINSEGPTVTSGSKAYRYVDDEHYIEKITIKSAYTGSIQFILRDSTTIYGSSSLSNDVMYTDTVLTGWTRTIPSGSLLEFLVSTAGGISSGSASTFLFLVNTLRKLT